MSPRTDSKSTDASAKTSILLSESRGVKTKSDFVRARLLGETFKVIVENPSTISYLERLTKILALTNRTGLLYIDWS
ncbi:plasmid mobilization protein [Porphyromonas miyakawae]|uniref:plasmid mobilization protein n=1 Tax=Porphyromonas miyakawae TaxID=3137470 RepID=UPI00398C40D3